MSQRPRAGSLATLEKPGDVAPALAPTVAASPGPDAPQETNEDIVALSDNTVERKKFAERASNGFLDLPADLRPGALMLARSLGFPCGGPEAPVSTAFSDLTTKELIGAANTAAELLRALADAAKPSSVAEALNGERPTLERLAEASRVVDDIFNALRWKPVNEIEDKAVSACIQSCTKAVEQLDEQHPGSKTDVVAINKKLAIAEMTASINRAYTTVSFRLTEERSGKPIVQQIEEHVAKVTAGCPPENRDTIAGLVSGAMHAMFDPRTTP